MGELAAFIQEQWLLTVPLVAVIWLQVSLHLKNDPLVRSPAQVVDIINRNEAPIFDLRPASDFAQGAIAGAENFTKEAALKAIGKIKKVTAPIILVCMNGVESQKLSQQLREEGRSSAFYMKHGMNTWTIEQYPTIAAPTKPTKKKKK